MPTIFAAYASIDGNETGSEGPLSANAVLGHFPAYVAAADVLGAARFSVPAATWRSWTPAKQWSENRRFLDESMRRGRIVTTAPPGLARPSSAYWRELVYLRRCGYPTTVQQALALL